MATYSKAKAIFLDRDGVLNQEIGYLFRWEDWHWLPGVPEALAALKKAGFLLIVVSNQSGVARGFYSAAEVRSLHKQVNLDLERRTGIKIDAFYFCPHHPDLSGPCPCRKPSPGLLLQAATDRGLDLSGSWMLGDKLSDLEAGWAAQCRSILLLTGYGQDFLDSVPGETLIFNDLPSAARHILNAAPEARPEERP